MVEKATFGQRRRRALRIGGRLALALVVVLLPWPGLGRWFAGLFSSIANAGISPWLSSATLLRVRPEGPLDSWSALLTLGHVDGMYQELAWDVRRTPYLPMAVFTALVVAIPFGRPARRLLVLALGLTALQILPTLRLLLLVSAETPERLIELPRIVYSALLLACGAFVFPPGMAYVIPAALWVGLMALVARDALVSGVRSLAREPIEPSELSLSLAQSTGHGVLLLRPKKREKTRVPRPRRSKKR